MADYRSSCGCYGTCTCAKERAEREETKALKEKGYIRSKKSYPSIGSSKWETMCEACGVKVLDMSAHTSFHATPEDKPGLDHYEPSFTVTHNMIKDRVNKNNTEECDACYELESICMYHEGVAAGAEFMAKRIEKAMDV